MIKFINKRYSNTGIPVPAQPETHKEESKAPVEEPKKNKTSRKKSKAMNEEKINQAEQIVNNLMKDNHVKVVKKDRGLIERTESSKLVLTEDNRQVLGD